MSDEEFFRRLDDFLGYSGTEKREPFPPEETGYFEVHWGKTPNGGDLSIGTFFDKYGRPCTREHMAYMHICEYLKDGTFIQSTSGAPPIATTEEKKEEQLNLAEETATERKWEIKGKAFAENNDLYVQCSCPDETKPIVIRVSHQQLGNVLIVDDAIEKFKALKLIKGLK